MLETEAVLVAVASTTTYGGGLRIAPDARCDDGLADVVVVRALSRPALLAVLPTVFAGWHTRHPAVTVHRAARVEVALADPGAAPLVAHGDGEPMAALPVVCEVAPGALRLLA
ncbi:MAG: Diacylglycerol kinase-related protein [uncultured Quadrisphaera sp.]|uniref:Diacylglycerol kinase-related protein n=1 Tax=uncultured Quadrisphaera sp. TaxID=904978 RepID=A0A6J4NZZ0_9ACTN|nr:MAG: Diacylglycerol kinase-related protein [uncultured Quadrisphaera sp.]